MSTKNTVCLSSILLLVLPIYRWGTKEEVDMLTDLGIEMECIEEERIGALATTIDRKKAGARFLQEAKSLAYQFLDE